MRVSIIVADNSINIDGVWHDCDCSGLVAKGISALQWYGTEGEIEYARHKRPNEQTIDLVPFRQYIDRATPRPTHWDDTASARAHADRNRELDTVTRTINFLRNTINK